MSLPLGIWGPASWGSHWTHADTQDCGLKRQKGNLQLQRLECCMITSLVRERREAQEGLSWHTHSGEVPACGTWRYLSCSVGVQVVQTPDLSAWALKQIVLLTKEWNNTYSHQWLKLKKSTCSPFIAAYPSRQWQLWLPHMRSDGGRLEAFASMEGGRQAGDPALEVRTDSTQKGVQVLPDFSIRRTQT